MAKIAFRQQAIDDLNNIWKYTAEKWSINQANTYYASIQRACSSIGENPTIGKAYEDVMSNLLGLRTGKHIIFYLTGSTDRIEIIRILHGRMDLKNRLKE